MSERKQDSKTLFIPTNIKTRLEFFDGFGVSELIVTLAVTGIVTVIAIIFNMAFAISVTRLVFVVLVAMALTVTVLMKTESNLCVIDQIRFLITFAQAQKKFAYIYWEEWQL